MLLNEDTAAELNRRMVSPTTSRLKTEALVDELARGRKVPRGWTSVMWDTLYFAWEDAWQLRLIVSDGIGLSRRSETRTWHLSKDELFRAYEPSEVVCQIDTAMTAMLASFERPVFRIRTRSRGRR